jgi:hypothetical protein
LDLLVEHRVLGTKRVLEKIAASEREPAALRVHARSLLERFDDTSIARQ